MNGRAPSALEDGLKMTRLSTLTRPCPQNRGTGVPPVRMGKMSLPRQFHGFWAARHRARMSDCQKASAKPFLLRFRDRMH